MFHLALFILGLVLVFNSANSALKYSSKIALDLGLSKGTVGFLLIAFISVLPETFISALASLRGDASMGLGTLFGSNVADLTIVCAIVSFVAGRNIKVQSYIIKESWLYLLLLGSAFLMGMDYSYTRLEGVLLIVGGVFFHIHLLKKTKPSRYPLHVKFSPVNLLALILSMAILLLGAHFTVQSAVDIAELLNVKSALIGMFMIALGTTLPELFFAIKAVRNKEDSLALGDILGTVLTDGTIVVGIMALIRPFSFDARIVYSTGSIMVISAAILFYLMKTGKALSQKEALLLVGIYALFVWIEWNLQI